MKKSQILAALALAFALGVAMPVASTSAVIVDTNASATEIAEAEQNAQDALDSLDDLENLNEYINLYNAIEGDNGLAAGLKKITDNEVRWFNENEAIESAGSTNGYIKAANAFISSSKLYKQNADGTYKYIRGGVKHDDDNLTAVGTISTVSTIEQAVKSLRDKLSIVQTNISILKNNYTYNSTLAQADYTDVEKAIVAFDGVRYHLESELTRISDAYNQGQYWDFYTANWATPAVITWGTGSTDLINNILADVQRIDKDAAYTLTRSDAWTNTVDGYTGIQRYNKAAALISTARSLPKYCAVKDVIDAKANAQKVLPNVTTNVSYSQAKNYIAALNTAVKNFRDGVCAGSNNGGTGNGTNDGDNKPGQSAPDTGILANAEGSASTTVAMVAGIATALTAAGAGVVAYRNARRSTRK